MPKPIIYLLLLLTIGACSQKLDPKETIVCELTDKALICNKDDIPKLPKFEDLNDGTAIASPNFYKFDELPDKSLVINTHGYSIVSSFVQMLYPASDLSDEANPSPERLPIGKCTLHFLLLPQFKEYGTSELNIFCREHFNLILDNHKKYNQYGGYGFLNYINKSLRQNIKYSEKNIIFRLYYTQDHNFKIIFK